MLVIVALFPSSTSGQVDVTARIGRVGSSRVLVEEYSPPPSTGVFYVPEMKHRPAVVLGGSLTFWPWPFIGLELDIIHSGTDVETVDGSSDRFGGGILASTVRALPSLQIGDRLSMHTVLGGGLIDRKAFRIVTSGPGSTTEYSFRGVTTRVWTIGGGARFRAGSRMHLRLDAENLISSPSYEGIFGGPSPVQHDVVLAFGLSARL
jgi:hypothetical protein